MREGWRHGAAMNDHHLPLTTHHSLTHTITPTRSRPARGRPVTQLDLKIHVVGVGSDGLAGLTARARELLSSADLLLGSEHALGLVPELAAERFRIGPDLHEATRILED